MKSKKIKQALAEKVVVHFNGFMHKVLDFDGKNKFFIHDSQDGKWVHKDLIVWS